MSANLSANSDVTGFVFTTGVNDDVVFREDFGGFVTFTGSLITDAGLVDGEAYTGDQVAAAMKTAMETVAPAYKFAVSYDEMNGLFSVTNDAVNAVSLEFRWGDPGSTASSLIGFRSNSGTIVAGATDINNDVGDVTAGAFDVTRPVETSNFSTSVTVYDSLGNSHQTAIYFRKSDVSTTGNTWNWYAVVDAADSASGLTEVQANGTLDFDTNGALNSESMVTYPLLSGGFDFTGGATLGQAISFDFGNSITEGSTGLDGVTQYGESSALFAQSQDGYGFGTLSRTFIDTSGVIMGVFTNGTTRAMGQIALAKFNNPAELFKTGGNLYTQTNSSGDPLLAAAGSSNVGTVHSNTLELSTVDIAEEFVKMITAQRGFQANSRVITTSDEMLVELVNLKR
ncbi:MAG: flagellar hook-basal body complex protein [Thermodesulfobacteriota bacterium]